MILHVSYFHFLLYILILCITDQYLLTKSIDTSDNNNNNGDTTSSSLSASSSSSSSSSSTVHDPTILPFFIGSDTSNTLRVTSDDNLVQCEIYYDTKVAPVPLDDTVLNRKTSILDSPLLAGSGEGTDNTKSSSLSLFDEEIQQLITGLQDKCVNYDADGFIYEICIGGRVRQRGRNSDPNTFDYLVGTYHEGDTKKYIRSRKTTEQPIILYYTKGDKCGEPDPLRRAEVSLHCGPGFTVLNGEERSICSYHFAVTHPSLCKRNDVFITYIPPVAKYDRDNNVNSNNVQDTNPLDFVHSLPIAIQQQLNQLSIDSETILRDALTKAITDNQENENHPTSGLSEADVAGTGGKSIGVDDRERHGGHWTGVTPGGQRDSVSSWFMEIHPLWPEILIEEEDTKEEENQPSAYRTEWTCTALSTDDLRKGIEVTGLTSATPSFISLALTIPKSLGVWNADLTSQITHANLLTATARSSNRQILPVQVQSIEDPNNYKVIVSVTALEVPTASTKETTTTGTEKKVEENKAPIIDINYVSFTVQVTTER